MRKLTAILLIGIIGTYCIQIGKAIEWLQLLKFERELSAEDFYWGWVDTDDFMIQHIDWRVGWELTPIRPNDYRLLRIEVRLSEYRYEDLPREIGRFYTIDATFNIRNISMLRQENFI